MILFVVTDPVSCCIVVGSGTVVVSAVGTGTGTGTGTDVVHVSVESR